MAIAINKKSEANVLSDELRREVEGKHMLYTVYILRFVDNSLYIGQTNNLSDRLKSHLHKTTKAAKFTKDHGNFEIVHKENYNSRIEAMRREKQIKGWTRAKKEALIAEDMELLKKL